MQIVFGDSVPPAKLHKLFAYDDPEISDRMGMYQTEA